MSDYKPTLEYGKLKKPQAVEIVGGKYRGDEGIILDDKSCGYYKVNVTPSKATTEAVDIHKDHLKPIAKLSMFTSLFAA